MILFLVGLVLLCCWGAKYHAGGIREDYLSLEQTETIRGIMACLIFCSHLRGYLPMDGAGDGAYVKILYTIGQCMVAPFFFYSGYGIVLSYRKKKDYAKGFLRKRLGITWVHFAVAVVLFYLVDLLLGLRYPVSVFLSALTGWDAVGNSNWFMFVTFVLYLIVWAGMLVIAKLDKQESAAERSKTLVILILLMSGGLVAILSALKESWWFDTLLCFCFGGAYCLVKERFDALCRHGGNWIGLLGTAVFFWVLFRRNGGAVAYNVCAMLFALAVTMVTMKLRLGNPVLSWLGRHSFFIYIYMRIPMLVMEQTGILIQMPVVFAAVALAVTCAMAWVMKGFHDKTDRWFLVGV